MTPEWREVPEEIPHFNWGAFFLPPVWGVAHGQWPGVFFLPLWVFVDNMLRGPRPLGVWTLVAGCSMVIVTVGFQAVFARNANRFAWIRTEGRLSAAEFVRRQRIWGVAGGIVFAGMALWITLFLLGPGAGA